MSKYEQLKKAPPRPKIAKNAKEVIFTTISCMCDNKHLIRFKKDARGEFQVGGCGNDLRNWQMKFDKYDLTWAADKEDWQRVIEMINTGTSLIESARSR